MMTELEYIRQVKQHMDKLARGRNPFTGRLVEEDALLNDVRLVRSFLFVSEILERELNRNSRDSRSDHLRPFYATREQLSRVPISKNAVRISRFVASINETVNDHGMKPLSPNTVTNWLERKGFLEKKEDNFGKFTRLPTQEGYLIGMFDRPANGPGGEYTAVWYRENAQRFILDNLPGILAKR